MNDVNDRRMDADEQRAEQELRRLIADVPAEQGPSQPYWDMYATRVMARIGREEQAPARIRWSVLWKPVVSMASMALAVGAFVMLHPVEPTLDQTMAQLGNDDVQVMRQADANMVPVGAAELTASDELSAAAGNTVDVDAVLAFDNADPEQITAIVHSVDMNGEPDGLDDLSDDDANAVLSNLKTSL